MTFEKITSPRLVGVSGTLGAGKDTVGDFLANAYHFLHISTGDVLRAEATARGLDASDRATLINLAVELQQAYGSYGALVLRAISQWQQRSTQFPGGVVISGIRIVEEAQQIRARGGTQLYIDADPHIRYVRVRGRQRDHREAQLTLDEFIAHEKTELEGTGNPARPHLLGIKAVADAIVVNEMTREELERTVEKILQLTH